MKALKGSSRNFRYPGGCPGFLVMREAGAEVI